MLPPPTATIRTQVTCRCVSRRLRDARPGCSPSPGWSTAGSTSRSAWARCVRNGAETVPLVRPHSECLTGDVFGSQRCDCGPQLREAVDGSPTPAAPAVPAAGGPGHRPVRQARRLRVAGRRTGHLRGEPGARPRGGRARLPRGGADAARAGRDPDHPADQQPGQGRAARPARGDGRPSGSRPAVHLSATNARYLATKASHGGHTLDVPTADGLSQQARLHPSRG